MRVCLTNISIVSQLFCPRNESLRNETCRSWVINDYCNKTSNNSFDSTYNFNVTVYVDQSNSVSTILYKYNLTG